MGCEALILPYMTLLVMGISTVMREENSHFLWAKFYETSNS